VKQIERDERSQEITAVMQDLETRSRYVDALVVDNARNCLTHNLREITPRHR
jgi:hypothetical protein